MIDHMQFSIVIPCYNERRRLPSTLNSVQQYLRRFAAPSEIIVVDDGSSDGTADWVRAQSEQDGRLRLVHYGTNRGKGYAVKTGMLEARGRFVLFMDADGATPIEEADSIWPLLESGRADVVVGSRTLNGSNIIVSQPALRRLAGDFFGLLMRMLVLSGIRDTQCGFKAFTHEACITVFSRLTVDSALFDIEVLLIAVEHGFRVLEVPIVWRHDNDTRITYNVRKSLLTLLELIRIKWKYKILWPTRTR